MNTKRVTLGAIGLLMLSAGVALAHHSGAMFDSSKQVKVAGVVKEFQFTNPHAWLIVSSQDAAGKYTDWSFEFAGGPSSLLRVGIKKGTFIPGEKVTVTGNPLRDGRPGANLVVVNKESGAVVSPRTGVTPAGQRPAG